MRRALAGALLALAALPAAADAATVDAYPVCDERRGRPVTCSVWLKFTAAPGEANDVTFTRGQRESLVHDAGAVLVTPMGNVCTRIDEHTARCPYEFVERVTLGDGDDRFTFTTTDLGPTELRVDGEEGDDTIVGGGRADTLDGGPGDDVLHGGGGYDTIVAGPGADAVEGGDGADIVRLADGPVTRPDRVDGGAFDDAVTYDGETAPVAVDLESGATGGAAAGDVLADVEGLSGGAAADSLAGTAGDDSLGGGGGDDRLSGRAGNDDLRGGAGRDTLDGAEGDDTLSADDAVPDALFAGAGNDALETRGGGLADAGPGDDRVSASYAPATPLRVLCGDGDDVAPVNRRVSFADDCEWLGFGRSVEVRRRLRLYGHSAQAIVRGFWDPQFTRPTARLVLRDARGRVLAARTFAERGPEESTVLLRPKLPARVWRRLEAGGSVDAALSQRRRGPRGRVTLVD